MSDDDKTRKQVEDDAKEDLEVKDEDADKVGGGSLYQACATGKHIAEATITH